MVTTIHRQGAKCMPHMLSWASYPDPSVLVAGTLMHTRLHLMLSVRAFEMSWHHALGFLTCNPGYVPDRSGTWHSSCMFLDVLSDCTLPVYVACSEANGVKLL